MSKTRLMQATIGEFGGPEFPEAIERFQQYYLQNKFKHFPITEDFLRHFAKELEFLLFHRVRFYEDFITMDDTRWFGVRVSVDDVDYIILFPKGRDRHHADGTVSTAHVAIHYDTEGVTPDQVGKVAQALYGVFEMARRDYPHST